ncbi:hypothetical protein ACIRYZ_14565 [Kitasatospora sp. NPDC101155]
MDTSPKREASDGSEPEQKQSVILKVIIALGAAIAEGIARAVTEDLMKP